MVNRGRYIASGAESSIAELQNEQQFVSLVQERLDVLRAQGEASVRTATGQVGTGVQVRIGKEITTGADERQSIADERRLTRSE